MMKLIKLELPQSAPLRERLRITWRTLRFVAQFNRRTPEQQDRIMAWLAEQPGVTVTKK